MNKKSPKSLINNSRFSPRQLLMFGLVFGLVGAYILIKSFAAGPTSESTFVPASEVSPKAAKLPAVAKYRNPDGSLTLPKGIHLHKGPKGEADINLCSDDLPAGYARCNARLRIDPSVQDQAPKPNGTISPIAGQCTVPPPYLGNCGAYDPAFLQSAYNVPFTAAGTTVAIVDAYGYPTAESDLATYRSTFGLPACTTANGCFRKVDQRGGTNYPPVSDGTHGGPWDMESALDLDMVSAMCPNCHLILVQSDDNSWANMGQAVNEAVALGASVVSNSYGGSELPDDQSLSDTYYNHPGVAVVVSAGDVGYGPDFPASSNAVVAVGGTRLYQATNTGTRNATETVWSGNGATGGGCSRFFSKPSWQKDIGCTNRLDNDVSAVADPATPVWFSFRSGFGDVAGTSVSAPLIAGMLGLAGNPSGTTNQMPSIPYANTLSFYDITSGSNASCGNYECTAGPGYDGPSGWGTPNGVSGFRLSSVPVDSTPPSVPANLTATTSTNSSNTTGQVDLNWSASSDNVGVSGYRIFRNGAQIDIVGNGTSYTDTTVKVGQSYTYQIRAHDAFGNESALSNTAPANVSDTAAPTITGTFPGNGSEWEGATFSCGVNATDNVGVSKVDIYFDSTLKGTLTAPNDASLPNQYLITLAPSTLPANGSHTCTFKVYDAAGNVSPATMNINVSIIDGVPPTVSLTSPANGATVSGTINLTALATDNKDLYGVLFTISSSIGTKYVWSTPKVHPTTSLTAIVPWDSTTVHNGAVTITAQAQDQVNNTSTSQVTVNVSNGDTTPPSASTNLTASAPAYNQVNLSWNASTDNIGVVGYYVIRNGVTIATSTTTSYTDSSTTASASYSYQVEAYDAAGNISAPSATATVTTPAPPDTTPPSAPPNLTATAASYSQVDLAWSASTDNIGVSSYDIYRNGTKLTSVAASATSYGDTSLNPGTSYSYYVLARDAAGNTSPASNTATISTPTIPVDTTAPSVPANLIGSVLSPDQVNLTWTASSDNIGVDHYDIYRNNARIASVPGSVASYGDGLALAKTSYSYWVYAFDAAGNKSNVSSKLSLTTPALSTTLGSLTGRLTNAAGAPLSGAKVSYTLNGRTSSVSSSSSGNYTISNLPADTLNLTYSLNGYAPQTASLTLYAGANTSQDLTLNKLGSITGTITNSSTNLALSNVVVAYQLNGANKTTKTNNKGIYTITALPAGSYSLTYSLSGYTTQAQIVNVNADQTTTQNVSLSHL